MKRNVVSQFDVCDRLMKVTKKNIKVRTKGKEREIAPLIRPAQLWQHKPTVLRCQSDLASFWVISDSITI